MRRMDGKRGSLTAILDPSWPIVSAKVLNPHLPADLLTGKAVVLDILLVLGDGRRICIELEGWVLPLARRVQGAPATLRRRVHHEADDR